MTTFRKKWYNNALRYDAQEINNLKLIERDKWAPYYFSKGNARSARVEDFIFDTYKIPGAPPKSSHALKSISF